MSLVNVAEYQEYRPAYGTLTVRDVPRADHSRPRVSEQLAPFALNTQPSGSLARAGDGWIEGVASGDHYHTVRIEAHDAPPDDNDLCEWDDVLDTPFATSGLLCLQTFIDSPVGEPVELGPPGVYRLRLARRPVTAGEDPETGVCEYRLLFWPVQTPPEPPRWLRRTGLLVDGRPAAERDAFDGSYRGAITDLVMLALWAKESAVPLTIEGLADRLLTTTTTVRDIIEHPRTSRLLRIDGDLDEVDTPLTVTVLAKQSSVAVRPASSQVLPPLPGLPAHRSTPARRATPGVRGARSSARTIAKRQTAPGARDSQPQRDGLDQPPAADPEQAG